MRNLPPRASWQDLKDFFRRSGKVTYANAFVDSKTGEQIGEVDFEYLTDAENAVSYTHLTLPTIWSV